MQPFTTLTGIAAPLEMINVDTDKIIPKLHLRTIKRTGLGKVLFEEMRFFPDGRERPDFVLNREPYRRTEILVAGENFGCGSSREHAPWALLDFGIRCVIAPSFADIFYNNCFKNGILPVILPQEQIDQLWEDAKKSNEMVLTVDLENQEVVRANGERFQFDVDPFRKHCMLNGLDDVGLTMQHEGDIESYETRQRLGQPWLHSDATKAA